MEKKKKKFRVKVETRDGKSTYWVDVRQDDNSWKHLHGSGKDVDASKNQASGYSEMKYAKSAIADYKIKVANEKPKKKDGIRYVYLN